MSNSRSLMLMLVALVLGLAGSAAAAEEPPDLYGFTEAPPAAVTPVAVGPAGIVLAAPEQGNSWLHVLKFLLEQGIELHLVASDEGRRLQLETWLAGEGVDTSNVRWLITPHETVYAGEWGPLAMTDQEGRLLLLDARYYQIRKNDDAAAGLWAMAQGVPIWRLPFFLVPCQVVPLENGHCIVSEKVFTSALNFNAWELTQLFDTYLGCTGVTRIPGPPGESLGCIDGFVRPLAGGKVLVSSSKFTPALEAYTASLRTVLLAVPGLTEDRLVPVTLPIPQTSGAATFYRSYLQFVETAKAILVPNFTKEETGLAEVKSALLKQFPGKTQILFQADIMAESKLSLAKILRCFPGAGFAQGLQAPKVLCGEVDPKTGCGLCFDECRAGQKLCSEETEALLCGEPAVDGCRDFVSLSCGDGFHCVAGACEKIPGVCDTMPEEGMCDGDVLKKCVGGGLITVDCAADAKFCALSEQGPACVASCVDVCENGAARCNEAGVRERCQTIAGACLGWVPDDCAAGVECLDGQCLVQPDVLTPDVTDVEVADGEPPTFGGGGSSCSVSVAETAGNAPGTSGVLAMLLLLGWLYGITRRCRRA